MSLKLKYLSPVLGVLREPHSWTLLGHVPLELLMELSDQNNVKKNL